MDWSGLMALHGGYAASRILHAAVDLDLFTHLARLEGRAAGLAIPAPAVAAAAGTEPRATELLLNALVALGLLTKEDPDDAEAPLGTGGFRTTEAAQRHLVDGAPNDFRGFIGFDAANWRRWESLADAVRTGAPVAVDAMFQSDADATGRFIDAMEAIGNARGDVEVLPGRIDLSRCVHLLDVGGGSAAYSLAFLQRHPHLQATVIDLPGTLEVTRRYLAKAPESVRRRLRLVACDYRAEDLPLPPPTTSLPNELVATLKLPKEALLRLSDGYDVAWVSNILHGENEAENRALAAKIHAVLRPGGRVVIKEHILDATLTEPAVGALFAVDMLLFTKTGRCYGFDEVRRWYEDAGFVDVRETPPQAPLTSSLVVARKPGGGLHEEIPRAVKLIGEGVSDFVRAFDPRRRT